MSFDIESEDKAIPPISVHSCSRGEYVREKPQDRFYTIPEASAFIVSHAWSSWEVRLPVELSASGRLIDADAGNKSLEFMMGNKTAQIPRSRYGVQEGVTISTAPDTGIGEMDICIDVDDYYTSLLWKGCVWVELTPPPDSPLLMRFIIQELVEGENIDTVARNVTTVQKRAAKFLFGLSQGEILDVRQ